MKESLIGVDKSLVFRETFNSASDVANNRYAKGTISSTGVSFSNGVAKFMGGNITYTLPVKATTSSVRIIFSYLSDAGMVLFQLKGSVYQAEMFARLNVSSGTNKLDFAMQDASPITTTFNIPKFTKHELIITNAGNVYLNGNKVYTSSFNKGGASTKLYIGNNYTSINPFIGTIELLEIYNRNFSDAEIKNLYQGTTYTQPKTLPLLLDFDSTRGVIEDRTGLNTLTQTNISIQKIGKVYSAYFNGSNSGITFNCPPSWYSLNSITVSVWFKRLKDISNGYIFIAYNSGFTRFPINIQLTSAGISIWTPSGSIYLGAGERYNKWYNVIAVISPIKSTGYINGLLVVTSTINGSLRLDSTYSFGIGVLGPNHPKEYTSKVQVYNGNPSPSIEPQWAMQLYSSQKGQFSL